MNCEKPEEGEPCNQCESCLAITKGRSLDVIELDAASNRGIDEVRDLRENVRFAPSSSRFKVYIVDEAHQLTREAFNALLKTLEEPPPHAKFILATTEADKMPETIVSRCQQYRFKPLPLQKIVENLKTIVDSQESCPIPEAILRDVLFLIAKTSDGGMRDAQSLFDQIMSLADESLTLEEVELVLGGVRLDTLIELTDSIRNREVGKALDLIHHCYDQGQDMALLVRDLLGHFRDLMVLKSAPDRLDLVGLPADLAETVAEQSKTLAMEDLLQGLDILFEAERRLKVTGSPRSVCEAAVVKLAKMPTTFEIEALLGRSDFPLSVAQSTVSASPEAVKTKDADPPPHEVHPAPGSESDPSQTSGVPIRMDDEPDSDVFDTLVDRWATICHRVTEIDVGIGGYLSDAIPESYANGLLSLGLPEDMDFHFKQLNRPDSKKVVAGVLLETIGVCPEIRFGNASREALGKARPSLPDGPVRSPSPVARVSYEDIAEAEPVVRHLLDSFDGVIVDIKNNPNR
jgi:DNA polymerase-3 subunit gamma/tau